MIQEGVKKYLADNLEINIQVETGFGPCEVVTIKLELEGDVISEDSFTLPDYSST